MPVLEVIKQKKTSLGEYKNSSRECTVDRSGRTSHEPDRIASVVPASHPKGIDVFPGNYSYYEGYSGA